MLLGKDLTLTSKIPILVFLGVFLCIYGSFGQEIVPQTPNPYNIQDYSRTSIMAPMPSSVGLGAPTDQNRYTLQLAQYEADKRAVAQMQAIKKQVEEDIDVQSGQRIDLSLPSFTNKKGSQHYRNAYAQLLPMQYAGFSSKRATFIVENAYYEDEKDYAQFEKTIKQTGDFLREKMMELHLDENSNLAKNYLLFQFFADTLEIKSKSIKHLPFEYDFDDFWGRKDWSKMFVQKLLITGKGQCNSLPRLYLILAEEIGAEAHLALSPNHSYIKFPDDGGNWHNIELTNNMLSTDAFILNSGYVKAEAIQNKIYMHPLNDQELLSNYFDQLAQGYIRKYGYDGFVEEVLDTALEIDPRNITAQLSKANLQTVKLKYATERLGITQENFNEIGKYPELVRLYRSVMAQYETVDNLGYAEMPQELYEKWLSSVGEQEQQQLDDSFKVKPIKQKRD